MARAIVCILCLALLPAHQIEALSVIRRNGTSGKTAPVATKAAPTVTKGKASSKTALLKVDPAHKEIQEHDGQSDKKFFGPPFPADYPEDKRPTVSPAIAWQLKDEGKPYPYLQSRHEFDRDYVKDENSDKGDWKAQFDYDAYRKKLADEEAAVKRAEEAADRAAKDEAGAQKDSDDAAKKTADGQKSYDDAKAGERSAGQGGDDGAGGSGDGMSAQDKAELERLRKEVAEAAANYEKEKKEFEECKKQLALAKQNLEDVRAEYERAKMDHESTKAAQTKLFAEQKASRQQAKEIAMKAAAAKVKEAGDKLDKVLAQKLPVDTTLAKKKADNDVAQKNLQMHIRKTAEAKKRLKDAELRLQKLRGYKNTPITPAKSGASWTAGGSLLLLLVALAW